MLHSYHITFCLLFSFVIFIISLQFYFNAFAQRIISAGNDYSLVTCLDSTVKAVGNNNKGQLGDGTTITQYSQVAVGGLTGIISISAGHAHSLALQNNGRVWAWGYNFFGQLGDSTWQNSSSPLLVTGVSNIIAISALGHSLALKNDGTVWAWGMNAFGQLGDSTTIDKNYPIKTYSLNNIIAISAGGYGNQGHSLFLRNDSTVWACGHNVYGQLGDGSNVNKTIPVPVSGLDKIVSISAGDRFSLALKRDSTVWGWGRNYAGQLGDGTYTDRNTPVKVGGISDITSISAGYSHSLALRADSTVWGWGSGGRGELDNNHPWAFTTPFPEQISTFDNIISVDGGESFTLFLMDDNTVWGTGFDTYGQLGDSVDLFDKGTPVQMKDKCYSFSTAPNGVSVSSNIICKGDYSILTVSGGILGTGAVWKWYSDSCGGYYIGTGTQTVVYPEISKNYYVRAEGTNNTTLCAGTTVIVDVLDFTLSRTDVSCYGFYDGSISAVVNSGIAPFYYYWSTGETSSLISGLSPAMYSVVVTDAKNCNKYDTTEIYEPLPLNIQIDVQNASCASCNDGIAITHIIGGTSPYSYSWSNLTHDSIADGLLPGIYLVTVSDGNLCTIADWFNVGFETDIADLEIDCPKILFNPSQNRLFVLIDNMHNMTYQISIINVVCEKVHFTTSLMEKIIEIKLDAHPKGIYFVNIIFNGKIYSRKFIKTY